MSMLRSLCLMVLLCSSLAEAVRAEPFSYDFERFTASGDPGTLVDDFNDGTLAPLWVIKEGTAVESGGTLTLSDPGTSFNIIDLSNGLNLLTELSQVLVDPSSGASAADGFGDFVLEVELLQTVLPVGHFVALTFGAGLDQAFSVAYTNTPPDIAAIAGVSAGLLFQLAEIDVAVNGVTELVANSIQVQQVLTTAGAITGNIHLRLAFTDATDTFTATASQDGGASFFFVGSGTANTTGWVGGWLIGADSRTIVPAPVPALAPSSLALLATLLVLGLAALGTKTVVGRAG